jgi:tryptophanyl-tRNA synthetase
MTAPSRRILSLKDPSSKMSKSSPDLSSRILLTDTAAQIKSKIRGAVTDSIKGITYDPVNRPGTANLLAILAASTEEDVGEVATRYITKGHGDLKNDVADAIEEMFKVPRGELEKLMGDRAYLESVAKDGAARAQERSRATLCIVRKLVGLV